RREIAFVLSFAGATPSRQEILGKLCALKNFDENVVVLDSLKSTFGKTELKGVARIYDDAETKQRLEPKHLIMRGAPKAEGEGEA
ncbi:MAG: 30S ribosomal protein S24e, partial [Methanomicrobiaceae archaeon]|nr:30S ribosomal protein S24e [Methanomicrobiaceae archaeon]